MRFIITLAVGIAAIVTTIALVVAAQRRRARLLKEAGAALGFHTFEKGDHLAIPSVEIMRKRGRTVGGAMEGSWQGEDVMVFDLSYPAGKNVSRTTIFLLRLPSPRIPEFAAIRKNIWLYTPTVDLPRVHEPPELLKHHWLLYAPAGLWPFRDAITNFLARNPDWSFEGNGSGLFVYQRAKRAPTKDLRPWLDEAAAMAREFAELL